jgi:predicted RNA-binding protein with PIN domain
MLVIIDGYNLIRQSQFRALERISLEEGRKALIRNLVAYRKSRGHSVTVVFDGWSGGFPHEERDREGGVEIIFSRIGEKADEVIKRLAAQSGEEITVVTSDREIATYASRRGKNVVASATFEALLEAASQTDEEPELSPLSDRCHEQKMDDNEEIDGKTKKKGPARRLSKQKRIALAALRKL